MGTKEIKLLYDTWNNTTKSVLDVVGTLTLKCGNNDGRACGLFWIIEEENEIITTGKE